MRTRYDFIEALMRGFESIFSFGLSSRQDPPESRHKKTDAEALASDWAKVYRDIERQMPPVSDNSRKR